MIFMKSLDTETIGKTYKNIYWQDADAVCINNNFLWKAKTSTCRQLNFVVLVVYFDIPVIFFLIIKDLWLQTKGYL
jgi:hypothetical protein